MGKSIIPNIHLHDERWKKALRPYCKTVELAVGAVGAKGEISIVLTNDAEIQTLNNQYRGKNKPTNVLSFPNEDEPLGDVVLAYETIACEAQEQGKKFKDHTTHLIVHGVLHLMGHDHEKNIDAKIMEQMEVRILSHLGVPNPYL